MADKKKIFDITPPLQRPQKPAVVVREPEIKKPLAKEIVSRMPRSFRVNKPILIAIALLIVAVLCFIFIEHRAVIGVQPVRTPVEFASRFSSAGEIMKKEHFLSQEFTATGKAVREEKAQGIIKVYNNYHLDQILVANTRFWCFINEELREFKTKDKVVIPSQQQLDVEVVASTAGEEYNIGPCTFSVPGLKGSPRYTFVYGESSSNITGGKKIKVTQVTQADLDKAGMILKDKALEECRAALEAAISPEEYIMIEESMKIKITELVPLTEVGQVVDNFVFQVKAEGEVLALRRSELQDFAKNYVLGQVPEGKVLIEGSLGIGYLPETINFEDSEIILNIEISAEIYSAFDEDYLKERVINLRPEEIMTTLRNFPEIEQVGVRFSPFWVTTAPNDTANIEIKVVLD